MNTGLFVALDVPNAVDAMALVQRVQGAVVPDGVQLGYKVGMELFYREGLSFVRQLQQQCDGPVFLDVKLHDIPNTVYRTARNLASCGVRFFNVHASGGKDMMEAAATGAREGAKEAGISWDEMSVIAVTILTSTSQAVLEKEMKVTHSLPDQVAHLAGLAQTSGLHGVVCSAQEASMLTASLGADFLKVTPGIRLKNQQGGDDQVRVMTPERAIQSGATHLVVGRPITQADHPSKAAEFVMNEMAGGVNAAS